MRALRDLIRNGTDLNLRHAKARAHADHHNERIPRKISAGVPLAMPWRRLSAIFFALLGATFAAFVVVDILNFAHWTSVLVGQSDWDADRYWGNPWNDARWKAARTQLVWGNCAEAALAIASWVLAGLLWRRGSRAAEVPLRIAVTRALDAMKQSADRRAAADAQREAVRVERMAKRRALGEEENWFDRHPFFSLLGLLTICSIGAFFLIDPEAKFGHLLPWLYGTTAACWGIAVFIYLVAYLGIWVFHVIVLGILLAFGVPILFILLGIVAAALCYIAYALMVLITAKD